MSWPEDVVRPPIRQGVAIVAALLFLLRAAGGAGIILRWQTLFIPEVRVK
jgi:hypothetical protein